MAYKIVFCDVDGTLLNSKNVLLPGTRYAIMQLQQQGIPFVIASGRSPSGVYPILKEYGFSCPVIAYSGALAVDEEKRALFSTGMDIDTASDVLSFIRQNDMDLTWNIFSEDVWIVDDKKDARVRREERIVRAHAIQGTLKMLKAGALVNKILCICHPNKAMSIEQEIKAAFPSLSIVRSADTLLEIMHKGVSKLSAVEKLCKMQNISLTEAIAFGDNYNDVEMLEAVGLPFLMDNAPMALKQQFQNITLDNDSEGIYHALKQVGLIHDCEDIDK